MPKSVFINLHVKDLDKSKKFFQDLGFSLNLQFTDENASCVIVSETIYVMILREEFFRGFTEKEIADTSKTNEVIISFSAGSKSEVDEFMEKVLAAGGIEPKQAQDLEFMYNRTFLDPDGHCWEIFWFDESHLIKEN